MTEIKSCISCVHCHKAYGDYWCMKYKIDTIDYVTGKTDWMQNDALKGENLEISVVLMQSVGKKNHPKRK